MDGVLTIDRQGITCRQHYTEKLKNAHNIVPNQGHLQTKIIMQTNSIKLNIGNIENPQIMKNLYPYQGYIPKTHLYKNITI